MGSHGILLSLILLSCLLLDTVFLLASKPPDVLVQPGSGIDLSFNRKNLTLSWACQDNARDIRCILVKKDKTTLLMVTDGACSCSLLPVPLHGGLTLEVHANVGQRGIKEKLVYPNPGLEGTAAQSVSCFVYNGASMSCSWEKGPTAPSDVQYFLYMRDERTRGTEMECPHYTPETGTHTGCLFRNLTGFEFLNYFLLTGTSQRARIQFFDFFLKVSDVEHVTMPSEVTVHCSVSHCLMWWQQPHTLGALSSADIMYQVGIQKQGSSDQGKPSPEVYVNGNIPYMYSFRAPQPRAPHTVRVRAANVRNGEWSAWSQPVEIGLPPFKGPAPRMNLKFNLQTMQLSWVCLAGATNLRCLMTHGDKTIYRLPKNCRCTFPARSPHEGLTLEVHANINHRAFQEKLVYPNRGQ